MPTIKTIKPGGGGDYTTLQTWESWADGQGSADQWAECYDGGDLGEVTVQSWTATPSPTLYPRIYVAEGEGHDGTAASGGAYINHDGSQMTMSENYTRVEGLRIVSSINGRTMSLAGDGGQILDGCLIINDYGSSDSWSDIYCSGVRTIPVIVRNNIIYGKDATRFGIYFYSNEASIDHYCEIYNNTVDGCHNYGIQVRSAGATGWTAIVENNICTTNSTDFRWLVGVINVTANNNCSDDATADDHGGTGNIINQTPSDIYVDEATDFNLIEGSPCRKTGKDLSADFTLDGIDNTHGGVEGTWDMGALAKDGNIKTIKPAGGGDYTTLQTWEDFADDQTDADQWAECYDGGDLGEVVFSAWTATEDDVFYPRIYTPIAERHIGQDDGIAGAGTGAYIDNSSATANAIDNATVKYLSIEGLRIEKSGSTGENVDVISFDGGDTGEGCVVDSNLILWRNTVSGTASLIAISAAAASGDKATIQNNICVCETVTENCDYGINFSNANIDVDVYNNTVVKADLYGILIDHDSGAKTSITENNAVFGSGTLDIDWVNGGSATKTSNNNITGDASADDESGTGHLISKTATDQFVDYDDNWNLKYTADAFDAGKTISAFDWDALHLDSDDWRPRPFGGAWDMGAMEASSCSSSSSSSSCSSSCSSSSSSGVFTPEIKTVKPDGGGDYTTLALWEDYADGQASAHQWAECYDGVADLGQVAILSWTATSTASQYPKIYTPLAERHDGTINSSGAWIDLDAYVDGVAIYEEYTRVEGIRFHGAINSTEGIYSTVGGCRFDSNLFYSPLQNYAAAIYMSGYNVTYVGTTYIRNNLIYSEFNDGIWITLQSTSGSHTHEVVIQNNTIDGSTNYGIYVAEINSGGGPEITLTIENNIATTSGISDFVTTITTGTLNANNNLSEDATADDDGGSDHLISQSTTGLYKILGVDHRLRPGGEIPKSPSVAIDAGKTISAFDHDALHLAADDWRPQGASWDMGALEVVIGSSSCSCSSSSCSCSSCSSSNNGTPTIKTIKPDGGGDYTTLALWEDYADGQSFADQWAECYDGVADLGTVLLSSWASTPTVDRYPRIYTPLAERHDGIHDGPGAWIDHTSGNAINISTGLDYFRVEGIRIAMNGGSIAILIVADNVTIDSCFVDSDASTGYGYGIYSYNSVGTRTINIINNIFFGPRFYYGWYIISNAFSGTVTTNLNCYNNTIDGSNGYGTYLYERSFYSGTSYLNIEIENNIITNSPTADFYLNVTNGTINSNNNISEDVTADDQGGTDNLISQTPSDIFVAEGTNHRLKAGGPAIDAGKTIGTFDWDAFHVDADDYRPAGGTWDMGAIESSSSSSSSSSDAGGVVTGYLNCMSKMW